MKAFIENYIHLPESDWSQISSQFRKREISKNEVLLQEGKICKHLYFLETGLLRFFIVREGMEVNKFFTIAPYFFTSQSSFNARTAARENIQSIEESVIWEISFEDNNDLLKLASWNSFARKITQEVQFFTEEILEEMQTATAEQRYQKMLDEEPELLQRIPLKHLASYLGIAPQSLSRIRKKLMERR